MNLMVLMVCATFQSFSALSFYCQTIYNDLYAVFIIYIRVNLETTNELWETILFFIFHYEES